MLKRMAMMAFAVACWSAMANADSSEGRMHPANDVKILVPPAPEFPQIAARYGLEGKCEVLFDLTAGGEEINVRDAACTHPLFCKAARTAVEQASFRVIDVPGVIRPGERKNIILPIEFLFEPEAHEWTAVVPCSVDLLF